MSGKKLVNSENESKQPDGSISVEETLSEEEDANTTIPTVMITKSDSESMINYYHHYLRTTSPVMALSTLRCELISHLFQVCWMVSLWVVYHIQS